VILNSKGNLRLGAIQIIRDILGGGGGVNTMSHWLYLHFETVFLVNAFRGEHFCVTA
jgi:hypothetical protein